MLQARVSDALDVMIASEHAILNLIPTTTFLAYLRTAVNDFFVLSGNRFRLNEAGMREIWDEPNVCSPRVIHGRPGSKRPRSDSTHDFLDDDHDDLADGDGASVTHTGTYMLCHNVFVIDPFHTHT